MFWFVRVFIRGFTVTILKVTAEEKKHLQANIHCIFTSLLSKGQNHLVPLEGSSNNTCWHPPPPIDCMKTFPFSLHLFKHVALFRRFMSRGLIRTPSNQPGEVFLPPRNVKFSLPQGDVFEGCGIYILPLFEMLIAAHVERTVGRILWEEWIL